VFDAEVAVPVGEPDLAATAVDAAEREFVAEPGLVVFVVD
jgi:hypothetical protein